MTAFDSWRNETREKLASCASVGLWMKRFYGHSVPTTGDGLGK